MGKRPEALEIKQTGRYPLFVSDAREERDDRMDRPIALNARKLSTRQINSSVKELIADGNKEILIRNPDARHNLAVGITKPCKLTFEGSIGYYCCSFCDGINAIVKGNSGWGFGDNLMSGRLFLSKAAGTSVGASMRGGEIFVGGDAASRAGILMKGGTLIIAGDSGFLTGFMMQKGKIIVLGNVGHAAGDSMYEGVIYVGGDIGSIGADAKIEDVTPTDLEMIHNELRNWGVENSRISSKFRKIVSMKRLYHYDALEPLEKERMVI